VNNREAPFAGCVILHSFDQKLLCGEQECVVNGHMILE